VSAVRSAVSKGASKAAGKAASTRAGRVVTKIVTAPSRAGTRAGTAVRKGASSIRARVQGGAERGGTRPGAKGTDPMGNPDAPAGTSADSVPPGDRRARVLRQDNDFSQGIDPRTGQPKSHFDGDGNLVPANPNGSTSPIEHVQGNKNPRAKGDSPWTSCFTEGAEAKIYGAVEIEVDVSRLQADIAAGRVRGVEIVTPEQLQASIRQRILEVHPGTDIDAALGSGVGGISEYTGRLPLSGRKAGELDSLLRALFNTSRDAEWLIRGIVPVEYLSPPHPTPGFTPPGGGGPGPAPPPMPPST
jgi:hypothetical protein